MDLIKNNQFTKQTKTWRAKWKSEIKASQTGTKQYEGSTKPIEFRKGDEERETKQLTNCVNCVLELKIPVS